MTLRVEMYAMIVGLVLAKVKKKGEILLPSS